MEKVPHIAELIHSEKAYVNKLGEIVNGYIKEYSNENSKIQIPDNLKAQDIELIFGNIEEIYYWHKNTLLKGLKDNQHSILALSKLFIENEHKFHMYTKYINNKSKSDYLINKHIDYFDKVKDKLKQKQSIAYYMIEPVQRLPRYILLFDAIIKQLTKNGSIEEADGFREAYNIIQKVCEEPYVKTKKCCIF